VLVHKASAPTALAGLGSRVPKGCNNPQCAAHVVTAGTQGINQQGEYIGIGQCRQQHVKSQLTSYKLCPRLQQGAAAALGSWVLKGCNRPLYAAFVMSAGTHSINRQGEYVSRPQCDTAT
jgi:hypothetical protein